MSNDSARRIGGIGIRKTENSTRYTVRYFVRENDLATYTPEIGDEASWAPEYAVIVEVKRTWAAEGAWLLDLAAEPRESSGLAIRITGNNLNDFTEKAFYPDIIHIKHSWLGVRIAETEDCTPAAASNSAGIIIPAGTEKYLSIYNIWANPGDCIFCNATPLRCNRDGSRISSEDKGSASFTLSPFSGTIPNAWIDQDVPVRRYECTFATYQKIESISAFTGISGRFGSQCSPGTGNSGKWKALEQTLKGMRDANGRKYTLVKRKMLEAPQSLTWNSSKFQTWEW